MNDNVSVPATSEKQFIAIPSSVKLAILIPTARWTAMAQSVIASFVGVANQEVAVLIADNSENEDKRAFLQKICAINPHILVAAHEKNIGALANILYLFDWCKDVPFCVLMAWVSPTYYTDAFQLLRNNPDVTCAEVGNTLIDVGGSGNFQNISQATMRGQNPIDCIQQWGGTCSRVTTYNVSRRSSLESGIYFYRTTPLNGLTLLEDLFELSRLSTGSFVSECASGCFIHYSDHVSALSWERYYSLLYKDTGLQLPFVYLSTAIQCALFLKGNLSPIVDAKQKEACTQTVFRHIFVDSFLPLFSSDYSQQTILAMFAEHPKAMEGSLKFCRAPFINNPVFNYEIVDWLIEVIRVFEAKPEANTTPLSERFDLFVDSILCPPNM
jgi:hypothetical protein